MKRLQGKNEIGDDSPDSESGVWIGSPWMRPGRPLLRLPKVVYGLSWYLKVAMDGEKILPVLLLSFS